MCRYDERCTYREPTVVNGDVTVLETGVLPDEDALILLDHQVLTSSSK